MPKLHLSRSEKRAIKKLSFGDTDFSVDRIISPVVTPDIIKINGKDYRLCPLCEGCNAYVYEAVPCEETDMKSLTLKVEQEQNSMDGISKLKPRDFPDSELLGTPLCLISKFRRPNKWQIAHHLKGEDAQSFFDKNPELSDLEKVEMVRNISLGGTRALDDLKKNPDKPIAQRDVNPSNIIIGEDDTIGLIDFNLATIVPAHSKKTIGAIRFIPPEQFKGVARKNSDIFGLALSGVFLLRGEMEKIFKNSGIFEEKFTDCHMDDRYNWKMEERNKLLMRYANNTRDEKRKQTIGLVRFFIEALRRNDEDRPNNAKEVQELLDDGDNFVAS